MFWFLLVGPLASTLRCHRDDATMKIASVMPNHNTGQAAKKKDVLTLVSVNNEEMYE